MAKEDEQQQADYSNNMNTKLRDMEQKQRVLKDRLILVGNNLIDVRDETNEKINDMKKEIESLKEQVQRMKSFAETISEEFSKFARKEDLEILAKQAKMFDPLELDKNKKQEDGNTGSSK
ncbi:MAG: hypothetical protein ABEI74_03160 [Candidatus Pacearchaeota archaeon]